MQSKMNRKGFWLLLTLAVLIVAVSVIVTLAISADPEPEEEIQDFGFQTLSSLNLAGDSETDLRFFFTVGKLTYTRVGFVFSKYNDTPTIGGAYCHEAFREDGKVFRSITADSQTINAPDERYYVAVKLTGVPHSYFDGALYVRAYVTDGEGTRYSEPKYITVCSAKGHTHTVTGEPGEYKLYRTGHCNGCDLDDVCEYGVTSVDVKKWTGGDNSAWREKRKVDLDILGNGTVQTKHFYPDASNNYAGNDLLIEYSVLWNETLLNLNNQAYLDTRFGNENAQDSKGVCYWSLADAVSNSDSPFAGSFEYSGLRSIAADGVSYTPAGMIPPVGSSYDDYPNIGGTDQLNPEWGWHRIQIRVHEEVTNLSEMQADMSNEEGHVTPEYYLTATTYIDGKAVSKLCGNSLESDNHTDYKLFNCTSTGNGGVTYSDTHLAGKYLFIFAINPTNVVNSSYPAYFISGDYSATAGHSFVQNVTRVDNPVPRVERVDDKDFPGAFFYTTVGAHEHAWNGVYTQAKAPTLIEHGTEVEHCTVCGQSNGERSSATAFTPSVQVWDSSSAGTFELKASLKAIRDGKHFYPKASSGNNDLLIEYSILWNPTMLNFLGGDANPFIATRIADRNAGNENNIAYWSPVADNNDAACKFAGGFEYGTMRTSEDGNPYPRMIAAYNDITAYPNIGGANNGDGTPQGDTQWGWHRVQIRMHQDLTNPEQVSANSAAATYKFTTSIYIDGELVSVLSSTTIKANNKNYYNALFTAKYDEDVAGHIKYSDAGKDRFVFAYRFNSLTAKEDTTIYCAIADVYMTAGREFVQQVQKVKNPANATISLGGNSYSAKIYYASAEASVESVERLTDSSSGSFGVKKNIVYEVLNGRHFYPTEDNLDGNDLYVEYSVNWKADLINKVQSDSTYRPFIDSRISAIDGTSTMNNFTFWTLTAGNKSAACQYAGGFEYTDAIKVSETGNPYPNMIKDSQAITKYPNIGGANNGDGQSQVNSKYGWHRIGMQLHQEVTNLDAVETNGDTAQYKLTCRLYIDGKLVSIMSDYPGKWDSSNLLYTAASDGNGGVTYTDIGADRWLYIFRLNSTRTKSGETVDFEYKDCYATAGHSFVQPVDQHTHDFLTTNTGRHICAVCGANSNDAVKTNAYQKIFTSDNTASYGDRKLLSAIMGSKHFYPTNETPAGNDLLIEYSFLWNPTLSNFGKGSETSNSPFVTTRFSNWSGTNENVLSYWSLRDNCKDAWCKYAGGFEAGALQTVASDDIVAGGTPSGMCASGGNYAAYPNIGGATPADLANLNNGHQWGWHRVQIRLHQEVTNEAEVKGGDDAIYRFVCTTYFDGVAVSMLEKTGTHLGQSDGRNYLFSAESDGDGGITYSDNEYLTGADSVKRTIWAFKFNYTLTAGNNAYWEEADIYYTCGQNFVQEVEPVASPAYVDYEIASGVHVNGATYYRVID